MNSSDLTISSDWDIIDNEMSQLVPSDKTSGVGTSEDLKENVQKGSCVDDIPEQEVNVIQEGANIAGGLDIISSEVNNHQESSSSSEFDVLDETVEDNQSNVFFSNMEYSMSSSLESSHPTLVPEADYAEVEQDPQDETPKPTQEYNISVHPYLLAIALSLAFIAILFASAPFGSIKQMKERISALKTENNELKNLVQSKLENDKALMALEEQIKSLKYENFKLSESMKALVIQLEEQAIHILKKNEEGKVHDTYRNEIEKLKEQINILHNDNEELQKQLLRTRYGIYSPHPKEPKANPSLEDREPKANPSLEDKEPKANPSLEDKEPKENPSLEDKEPTDKADNNENQDNSSDILQEEMDELREKLFIEIEKMRIWKDSMQHLMKTLVNGNAESSADDAEETFKRKKSSERPKESKTGKKDKKNSDWSWGGVKKNLKDTFEGLQDIDVPNMISNYVDKKKIEGVFESVGHYFKKAQEKTKKVLNFNHNEEMWSFFGQLRNQWDDVTNKYFQKNYPTKQTPPETEDYRSHYHERKPKSDMPHRSDTNAFDAEKKFDRYEKQTKPKKASNENNDNHFYPDLESFMTWPTMETPDLEKKEVAPGDKAMNEDNSWVFKRAAHRSQLREEEEEAFTNWFLKRGQDFHYNEDESLKEWFKEIYRNGNSEEE